MKPGVPAPVTFVVTNTGEVDLFNVRVDDETIEGTAGVVTDIKAEGSDSDVFAGPLKPGEKTTFTGTLVLEEGGLYHADRAHAEGVPPKPGRPNEPGDVPPVPSDPDEGHAKTPGEPKLELKKFINDNDAQTADEAEVLKPGEKAMVKFVVKNTGEVDLFNVTVSDETVAGVGDVVNIEPKQIDRLKVGESGEFTGELILPEGGQDHKDVAHAEGVPPKPGRPNEPGDVPSVPSDEDPAHARTPKNFEPKVETSASVDKDGKVAAVESDEAQTVYDTVTVSNLVEDAPYTLDAQLMKKSDGSEIAGASASKNFMASESELKDFTRNEDGSVSGSVVVEIPLPASSLSDGDSAVAFETLTSSADKAKENRAEKLTDGSEPSGDVIADHKDINDEAQTVTYQAKPEPGEPKLELKKFINDNDAQTADEAEVLKPGEKAMVKFVVKNTGEVDLFNVTLSDETVAGVGDVVNIEPKQIDRLKVGESGEFTGELILPEGGQEHKDVAKAEGVPPSPENPDEPGDVPPVPSNEDPAHAKTPKPDEPKLELKKYINGNDAQTAEDAVMASKAGEELEVTFVVTNSGAVDVFNVTVEDSLLDSDESGVKVDDPKPASAEDEAKAQRLAPGEKVTFKGTIPAPESGKLHADQAKAKGVAPKPGNPDEPGDTPVESNEDPAHAKTPKPGEPTEEPSEPAKPSEPKPTPSVPAKPSERKPGEPEPKITTDAEIEDHGALVAGATVVDTVRFTNLVPGKKYELSAELMCKASGDATGATAKVTFLARVADGQINVPIAVTDGDCSEQVVFETLRNAEGDVVAVHHDINDEAQTVTAQDVLKPAPSKETQVAKRDHNVTRVTEEAPEVGKPVAPKTPRRSIKMIPSGSLVFEEGMPSQI
ncbi:VaFE repeat-containing surface-anchored protein [Corynebacterium mastitidis]|uniref:DUF7507 domain-containing protein n=1 Tax=Corynebacterium mastitidis TaxID=161890 RepID=UPI001F13E696|nr:VaFE repeat-containing surface-anchored protein [Corynebacterium mastitidis]MCH6197068.1 VaFE repeat-containing surface-anchored protein [Corynebacterium mastitidis]